jgi:UDP-2-acetamido-2-deoxy-ribo-hexuluronate aminotransferase
MAEDARTQIQMVDLQSQYLRLQHEIDAAIKDCLLSGQFIQGAAVRQFEQQLATYTGTSHVVSCANGTDALQLAMMALNLPKGKQGFSAGFHLHSNCGGTDVAGLTAGLRGCRSF